MEPNLDASGKDNNEKFKCGVCEMNFTRKCNLLRHCRRKHKQLNIGISRNVNLCCSICKAAFHWNKPYEQHLLGEHNIELKKYSFKFDSEEEFFAWKQNEEKEKQSYFVKHSGCSKRKGNKTYVYYYCHRSGNFKSRGVTNKRIKTGGSNKLDAFCPAVIKLIKTDSELLVHYVETHVHILVCQLSSSVEENCDNDNELNERKLIITDSKEVNKNGAELTAHLVFLRPTATSVEKEKAKAIAMYKRLGDMISQCKTLEDYKTIRKHLNIVNQSMDKYFASKKQSLTFPSTTKKHANKGIEEQGYNTPTILKKAARRKKKIVKPSFSKSQSITYSVSNMPN